MENYKKRKCVDCKFFRDYGPVYAHLVGSYEGECGIDGHKILGALLSCTIEDKRIKAEEKNYGKES